MAPTPARKPSGVLQFSNSKPYAARIAKNFPRIAMKLMKIRDFPLYFWGICSDKSVFAMITVIPKPIPARINVNKNGKNYFE